MNCSFCSLPLNESDVNYSNQKFKVPLCGRHQYWFTKALDEDYNTKFVLQLFLRLKELGADPFFNKKDGYKTVDIAIQKAGIHIEVDGKQHNLNPDQAMSDLKRTFHDLELDIYTIRIPNALVRENLNECAEYLMRIIETRMRYSIAGRHKRRQINN